MAFNQCFVKTYFFLRQFLRELKEHNIKSLEGLEVVDLKNVIRDNEKIILRLDTVSSGVYAFLDVTVASVAGVKAGINIGVAKFVTTQDPVLAVMDGVGAGLKIAAAKINYANTFTFVAAIKVDKENIKKELKNFFSRPRLVEIDREQSRYIPREEIAQIMGLNKIETKILYSLELHSVDYDIRNTKESKDQIKKNQWKKEWMKKCEEALEYNKLFEEDEEMTYKAIETHASAGDLSWLYKIVMELMLFKPYCRLDEDKTKYKGIKLAKNDYLQKVFCSYQNYVLSSDTKLIDKTYDRYYTKLSANPLKTAAIIAGAVVITAASAGAAFAFAPAIAVSLVGGSFAGLSGAALTSASLALMGGGAIAAGGLGMAGGTLVIAGGGALLGLGASGATATAFAMLASPGYVQQDYAKLLTKCDYILIHQYNMIDEVKAIQKQIEYDLNDLRAKIEIAKNSIPSDSNEKKRVKELIEEYEESVQIIENANSVLVEMINRAQK